MTPRFVIWDLDGTLIDSGPDIVLHANATREELGLPPLAPEVLTRFVGEGATRLMEQAIGPETSVELRQRAVVRYLERYAAAPVVRTRPSPGIDALVRALAGRQSVATNKPGFLARRIIDALGWSGLFRDVIGSDEAPRKPAPDMVLRLLERAGVTREEAVFVGDTPIDLATAEAAGIACVLVSWGLRPRAELARAARIVDSSDELRRALGLA